MPGKTADDGLWTWSLSATWKTKREVLAHGFEARGMKQQMGELSLLLSVTLLNKASFKKLLV